MTKTWWDWATLETRTLSFVFWASVGAFVLGYWLTPLPPAIDYPQHLALGALMRRLMDPSSPERLVYEIAPLTYNGLFHVLVAALSFVVPPEIAGKMLLSGIAVLTATAFLALVRLGQRPRWYAFLPLPCLYSHVTGWGFVNYTLAAPLALWLFTWWMRWRDGERRLWPRILIGAVLLAYAHVFAMLCLCVSIGIALLCGPTPRETGGAAWLRTVLRSPWPILPAAFFSCLVFLYHSRAPHIYWEPQKDGLDIPSYQKLRYLSAFAVSNLEDHSDEVLFWATGALILVLLLAPLIARPSAPSARRELVGLAIAWGLLYLVVPRVLMSTWYIFERIPVVWLAFVVSALPAPPEGVLATLRPLAGALGLVSGVNTAQSFYRIPDARDASAIVDDIPPTARVVAVMHGQGASPVIWRQIWVHVLAYHLVRHPGEIAFDFTRYASLPVRRRDARTPPLFASGLEWNPALYDPTEPYAEKYSLVLVRTPDDAPSEDPRGLTFGAYANDVRLLSHRGRFWLFDTAPLHR
jgi:hypothetical protein